MKIDQRGRREDRDDASISKLVEWFRAFPPSFPLSLSLILHSYTSLVHTERSNRQEGRNMSGAISIWIIRNFLYLIPACIYMCVCVCVYMYVYPGRISTWGEKFDGDRYAKDFRRGVQNPCFPRNGSLGNLILSRLPSSGWGRGGETWRFVSGEGDYYLERCQWEHICLKEFFSISFPLKFI